jgi:hypothetical protein
LIMKTYSPSSLSRASDHCPAALDYYEIGAEEDRSRYHVGTAAHAALQAVHSAYGIEDQDCGLWGIRRLCLAAGKELIANGRRYEDRQEPPLPPDDVWVGVKIAEEWLLENPPEPGRAELGLAVDRDYRPCAWDSEAARLRCILDLVTEGEDDRGEGWWTVLREFKTAWSTDKSALDTLQLKAQAVIGWAHFGPGAETEVYSGILQQVVNLRTGGVFERPLSFEPDSDGRRNAERWERELAATMDALDEQRDVICEGCGERNPDRVAGYRDDNGYQAGHSDLRNGDLCGPLTPAADRPRGPVGRPKAPGPNCRGCPAIAACEPLRAASPADYAALWVVGQAIRDHARENLEPLVDQRPAELGDGKVLVGWSLRSKRTAKDDAWVELSNLWHGNVAGALRAAGLTAANVRALAKATHPHDKPAADALFQELTEIRWERRFDCFTPDGERTKVAPPKLSKDQKQARKEAAKWTGKKPWTEQPHE